MKVSDFWIGFFAVIIFFGVFFVLPYGLLSVNDSRYLDDSRTVQFSPDGDAPGPGKTCGEKTTENSCVNDGGSSGDFTCGGCQPPEDPPACDEGCVDDGITNTDSCFASITRLCEGSCRENRIEGKETCSGCGDSDLEHCVRNAIKYSGKCKKKGLFGSCTDGGITVTVTCTQKKTRYCSPADGNSQW